MEPQVFVHKVWRMRKRRLLGSIRLESERTSCGGTFSTAKGRQLGLGRNANAGGVEGEGEGWFGSVGKRCWPAWVVVSPPGCSLFNQEMPPS